MHSSPTNRPGSRCGPLPWLGLPLRIHVLAWGSLLVLALLLLGVSRHYQGRNIWQGWAESPELRHPDYAERINPGEVFRTQANTWSNLAYVLVGLYALALGGADRRRPAQAGGYVVETPAMSLLFGFACCYLGFGSGLYHASLTHWGQQLDVAAMYAPLLACLAMHLGRWGRAAQVRRRLPAAPSWPLLAGLVVAACGLLYRYKWSMSAGVVLATLILLVGCFGLLDFFFARRSVRFRWLGWSSAALVAAITCRQLDVAGRFSGPDTWLQGHAIWHLLTAVSLANLYAYHRTAASAGPAAAEPLPS